MIIIFNDVQDLDFAIIKRTQHGGAEIVNHLKTGSAYYTPALSVIEMAEAILNNSKSIVSCCAWCESEYGIGGAFVGVPVILGENGVEKVIELDLNEKESSELANSVSHVKELISVVETMI